MKIIYATPENTTETGNYIHVTEASDLGILPGCWPPKIETNMGNHMPFCLHRQEEHDGQLQAVEYRQLGGALILRVLND